MNIAFFVYHPVEPHLYKHITNTLSKNHQVIFYLLSKENIEEDIIKSFGFRYKIIGKNRKNLIRKFFNIPLILFKIIYLIRKDSIDIVFSATSIYLGVLKKIINKPFIGFTDTETAHFNNNNSIKGFGSVLTPDCFQARVPFEKHIPFKGYKEIAYLHPNWFKASSHILNELNIHPNEKIILMRFSALKAMHDIGLKSHGENKAQLLKYIKQLEKHARVFISMTEKDLGEEFDKYKLNIHPSDYIHLLAYCSLYIGEGTTTASEAGVLGVPWINIQKTTRGYLIDQEENYRLGFRTDNIKIAFKQALNWIQDDTLLTKWKCKREKLIQDKIDVTTFLIWFIEKYPESHRIMKENPDYQNKFK